MLLQECNSVDQFDAEIVVTLQTPQHALPPCRWQGRRDGEKFVQPLVLSGVICLTESVFASHNHSAPRVPCIGRCRMQSCHCICFI
jgi:hypothetical protein